jgi:RimJ/RimL family protein N-acetyltransferase
MRPSDVDKLLAWRSEPGARRHQPLLDLTREELLAHYITESRLSDRRGERFQWIVEDGEAIGWVTLVIRSWEHLVGEIAYNLSGRFQGRGYGSEAARQLVELAFVQGGLYRLEARCSIHNEPSFRLLERVGFTREAILREYFILHGRRVDHYFYSLLRPEWEKKV